MSKNDTEPTNGELVGARELNKIIELLLPHEQRDRVRIINAVAKFFGMETDHY